MPFCPECGKPVGATAKFCRNCGASQVENAPPGQPVAAPAPPPPPPVFVPQPLPPPTPQAAPAPLQPENMRTCKSCGNVIQPGDKYCSRCLVIVKDTVNTASAPTAPAAAAAAVAPGTAPENIQSATQSGNVRTCKSCGNVIKPGDKFCSKCFVIVKDFGPVPAATAAVPPPVPVASSVTVPPETPPGGYVCASCKSPLTGTEKFCGTCGGPAVAVRAGSPPAQPAAGNVCTACGAPLSGTAKFCGACGAPVSPPEPIT